MRKTSLLLVPVTLVALVTGPLSLATSAAPQPKRAELVAKGPTASYANGTVTVSVTVKNKGNKKAKKSQTGFFLSTDGKKSTGDASMGALPTPKLKPKAKATVSGALQLPAGLQPGVYRLIACADDTGVVRERKEQNNCKASATSVTLPGGPPPPGKVTVSATATTGGTVAASGVTGGSCTGTFCTLTSGAGAVTFTPTTAAGYRFGGWSGCTGFTGTTAITFTNPTESKACTATFVKQVTITFKPDPILFGDVAASSVSGGSCAVDPLTKVGTCVLDSGASSVLLTATPVLPSPAFHFTAWTAADALLCDGVAATNTMLFTNPIVNKSCVGGFAIGP